MRVITGLARGRTLETVRGEQTRPTAAHVKESIFNIIQFDIEGRRVLDLFAGCGQMAIEALSRGAETAVLVDHQAAAVACIRKNLAHCGFQAKATVIQGDASAYLAGRPASFGLIFLDPPYDDKKLLSRSLLTIHASDLLAPGGVIVCESDSMELPDLPPPCQKGRSYRYGKKYVTIYTRTGDTSS